MYWIVLSSVSITPCPAAGAASTCCVTTSRPSASRPTMALPGVPPSRSFQERSTRARRRCGPRSARAAPGARRCASAGARRGSRARGPGSAAARPGAPSGLRTRRRGAPPRSGPASAARARSRLGRRLDSGEARGRQARATRHVLAGQTYLVARGNDEAELARALLDARGRAERRHLDLELADAILDRAPLGAQRVELISETDRLHTQRDDAEPGGHEQGRREQRADERAPGARVGIADEPLGLGRHGSRSSTRSFA